jgi:hypothetical protein
MKTEDLPAVDLFGVEELKQLALNMLLARKGISDPEKFMAEHNVEYVAAFKANVGIAVTVVRVTPIAATQKHKLPKEAQ